MKREQRNGQSFSWRLFVSALLFLLSLLVLSGGMSSSVKASPPMPASLPQSDNQTPSNNANATTPGSSTPATLVLRVFFHDNAERDRLATEFGAEEVPTTGGFLTVVADRPTYDSLLATGARVEIDQVQTDRLNSIKWDSNPDTFYGGYKTVEDMQTFLDQMVATYPTLAQKVDIGDSWCMVHPGSCTQPAPYNGYHQFALHITNQAIPGQKPVFFFVGGNHTREIAAPEVAMRYISYLLDGYNSDPDARWLVDYQDTWVVPIMNPDGHHIVEAGGGGNSPYFQRKNANNSNGCTTWPPTSSNQFGTDLNRNFPFLWNCCGGSSSDPCSEVYHGASANSEPETQNWVTQVRALIPDQRGPNIGDPAPITTTGILQDMHQSGGLNLYPWGMQSGAAPNGVDLQNIGAHQSALNAGGNGYQYCQPTNCLYTVDGDSIDWAYGELGIPAYTAEIADTFMPPYSQVDALWNLNKGMLVYSAKIARQPYLLTRGPDANVVATNPMTVTQGTPSQLTATINYAWTGNTYLQNVAAAEYYIDTPPWAGGTPIAMSGNFNSPTVAVQAMVDTTSLSVGRHILMVRGRGVNDYEGYHSWGPISAAWLWVTPAGGGTPTPTSPPPTSTSTPTRTNTPTPAPPTNTPTRTNTPGPASTNTPPPTNTATNTVPAPTDTHAAATATGTATVPPGATETPTSCTLSFTDVPSGSTFYTFIRCLACRGIINGYPDGTFKPGNPVTRGQLSKIVSNSAGFNDHQTTQMFQDVPVGSTFFQYIGRLASRNFISGYNCGGPGEPCVPPANLPYFRPNNEALRGQISKIVSNAAGFSETPSGQQFEDVGASNAFYVYIYRLVFHSVMSGYPCGTPPAGACVPPGNLPYFRPDNNATRGQTSKIVANTFFPDCQTPHSSTRR